MKYTNLSQSNATFRFKQVCVQLSTSAENEALPAFAATRHAETRLLLSAGCAAIDRDLLAAGPKQQTRISSVRQANDGMDNWTEQTGSCI